MPAYFGQLPAAARRRQADAVEMTRQVEVLVLDPHRMVQVQLGIGELCPELRQRLDPRRQIVMESIEGVATGNRGRVQLDY